MGIFRRRSASPRAPGARPAPDAVELVEYLAAHRTRLADFDLNVSDSTLARLRTMARQRSTDPHFLGLVGGLRKIRAMTTTTLTVNGLGQTTTTAVDLLADPVPPPDDPGGGARFDDPVWDRLRTVEDRYFGGSERAEALRKSGDLGGALTAAVKAAHELPVLVDAYRAAYGKWDITTSTAVELVARYAPVHDAPADAAARLDALGAVLRQRPELAPWIATVDTGRADIDLVQRVFALVAGEPGVVQSTLGRRLGADGRHLARLCRDLEGAGRLARRSEVKSYALFSTGTRP